MHLIAVLVQSKVFMLNLLPVIAQPWPLDDSLLVIASRVSALNHDFIVPLHQESFYPKLIEQPVLVLLLA
jgi:hypothetical protein